MPHPIFERKGNDLKIKIEISLEESLLGFTRSIKHLDGHEVFVDRTDQVTKPGLLLRMKKEGMPIFQSYGDYGDMLVTIIVNLPDKVNAQEKVLYQEFFRSWNTTTTAILILIKTKTLIY